MYDWQTLNALLTMEVSQQHYEGYCQLRYLFLLRSEIKDKTILLSKCFLRYQNLVTMYNKTFRLELDVNQIKTRSSI